MISIALLYICTGPYSRYFEGFYNSAKKYLLKDKAVLNFYVWTDVSDFDSWENVHVYHHNYQGFPLDSLFRFKMFLEAEDEIKKNDFTYFCNANALFVREVGQEFLPSNRGGLIAMIWERKLKHPMFFPYERNKNSNAYVPPFKPPYYYYSGACNGGMTQAYLLMVNKLASSIEDDYSRGIIAIYHDESHLNKYLLSTDCNRLGYDFIKPEEYLVEGDMPKIILRTKPVKTFDKGRDFSIWGKIKKAASYIIRAFGWYLGISIKSGQEKFIK